MNAAKHTPAPWQRNGSYIYGPDPDRRIICQMSYRGGSRQSVDTANESLVIAAPGLLDVLKRLSAFEFAHQGVAEGPLASILHQAEMVIAIAEGRL